MKKTYKFILLFLFSLSPVYLYSQVDFKADTTEGCTPLTVKFSYFTTAAYTIDSLYWDFGNGQTSKSLDPPPVTYTNPGDYAVTMVVNDGGDIFLTKTDYIVVHRTVSAAFNFADTLPAYTHTVIFRHQDQTFDPAATYSFEWNFDDGTTGTGRSNLHSFPDPGNYNVQFKVSDSYGCSDSVQQTVNVAGDVREQYIQASDVEGCDTLAVKFSYTGSTSTITSVLWNFGNGETSTLMDPDSVVYTDPGLYTVTMVINNDTANPIVKYRFIHVHDVVKALFEFQKTDVKYGYNFTHLDQGNDTSATYNYQWNFGDGATFTGPDATHTYADTGLYLVRLTVSDNYTCSDTKTQRLFVTDEIVIQNVFTPNEDGKNDYFEIIPKTDVILAFYVYSRTGVLVYSIKSPKIIWDGRTSNGVKLSSGIYYYVIQSLEGDTQGLYNKSGFIYLYR